MTARQRGFHLPQREPYAMDTFRRHHDEVLYANGEYALFVLMWSNWDHQQGRVARCSRCRSVGGATPEASEAIFSAFKQSPESKCPSCFGTTFEGGWRARIVRPLLLSYDEEAQPQGRRGVVATNRGQAQSTSDFAMRDGDYFFRGDGTRWRVSGAINTRINDGFGTVSRADNQTAVNVSNAVREDPASVAYSIPPTDREALSAMLEVVGTHFPPTFAHADEKRGPLIYEADGWSPLDPRLHDGHGEP